MTIAPFVPSITAIPLTSSVTLDDTALKLTCKQSDLAHGLSMVSRAVLAHSTKPILACILLSTDQGRLRISSTNLEIGIQVWVDAQIEGEGTTAIPAELLTKMVSLMPKGTMTLSIAKGSQTLHMQCAGSVSNIRGQDPREFPIIPGIEENQQGTPCIVEAGLLKRMVEQVAFAADTNDLKPVLTAVFMQIGGGTLTFAAANTFRLAERIAPLPGTGEPLPPVLVPARNLMELARVLPMQGEVQVVVTPQQNQVVFHCEQGERINFVSRLISGTYPPYQRSIPRDFATRAVIETRQFVAAVGRASLFARDEFKTARVTFNPSGNGSTVGSLMVEADDADMGNHISTVTAEVTGPKRHLIFPVRYLVEALERIETPQVIFSVIELGKPGVLKPMSEVQYTSMVMSAQERKTPTA